MEAVIAVTPSETIKCVHAFVPLSPPTPPPQNKAHRRRQATEPPIPRSHTRHHVHRAPRRHCRHLPRFIPRRTSVCLGLSSAGSMDVVLDDAARRQLGGAVHDLYHAQAVCAVHCASGSTASERDHVWDWCDCGPRDGLCHATTRVRLGNFVFARASDVWGSVIKTRMQALNAPQEYKNSFHCGYRILTEEGLLRFWTGTTPRLTRLVVSNTFNVHPYRQ